MKVYFIFANSKLRLHKPVNYLIRMVDRSMAGHFAICLETDFSKTVFEAVAPKSRKIVPYDEWLNLYDPVKTLEIEVPDNKSLAVIEWLEGMVGVRYGYLQVLIIGLSAFLRPFGLILNGININYKRAIICTELGSRFIENFLEYRLKETHDEIGVKDMEIITDELSSSEIKWRQI